MKVINDSEELCDYRDFLSDKLDGLIEKTQSLSKLFASLEWNDNIREQVCEILNLNLVEMGKAAGALNSLINSLGSMIGCINDYGNSTIHS